MSEGYQLLENGIKLILSQYDDHLFNWKWILVLGLTVFPWLVAYKVIGKERRKQYVISSLIIMVIASFLDIVGITYNLWRYYVTVFPVIGGFFPWNFSVLPVLFIISYEVFPKLSLIFKSLIVSSLFSFIGEPISDYIGLTNHTPWKHAYSVPIYFLIYLIAYYGGKGLSKKVEDVTMESGTELYEKDKYKYAFQHSFDAIYVIEKKHQEKEFRFTEVNESFCKEMGYTKKEVMHLDPRKISDQKSYNVDVKYRPLLKRGNMKIDTIFVTKDGEKKFVRLNAKVYMRKDKVEVLSIVKFLEDKVTDFKAT